MKRKGVSLSIETVVILIIAVVILGILVYFLITGSLPGLENIQLQQETSRLCTLYVQSEDPGCTGEKFGGALKDNCEELKYPACQGTTDKKACLKQCCIACS